MEDQVRQALDRLRLETGLYVASPAAAYHYIWIRDNCYIALANLDFNPPAFEHTYHGLLDIFRQHQAKLAYHTHHRPEAVYEYIHPRYNATSLGEIWEPWGNAQNDAIGAFLFGIGEGLRRNLNMLRDETDRSIIRMLIKYMASLEFWHDEDNGMWEENREVHTSSIAACTAGLLSLQPYFDVDWRLIQNGLQSICYLPLRESASHETDLALLSLIYPYHLLPRHLSEEIILRVETRLMRRHGVIRYDGDEYYAENNKEAQWCMGFPWLGLCHLTLGNDEQARSYLKRTEQVAIQGGNIPELYLAQTRTPNANTPLGWANALYLVLAHRLSEA